MPLPWVMPALADLTQEIAGPLPLELLRQWAEGTQDVATARELLQAFEIRGTVVASDTSGMSRLAEKKHLVEVLALISRPKSIIHALGVAVGGRAVGTWVADNSRMYYPESIAPEAVLAAMVEAQFRITDGGHPGVGMCVHRGGFYEIGGRLYGGPAETVERLAEHEARAGEVLVTAAVADAVAGMSDVELRRRPHLTGHDGSAVFSLHSERRMPGESATATAYPHAYPPDFFEAVAATAAHEDTRLAIAAITARYLRQRTVVFLSVVHERDDGTLANLLDRLVLNALLETIVRGMAGADGCIAGIGGGLAILAFDSARTAVDFALAARARLLENALTVKIGIDEGAVLLFPPRQGTGGIAGEPVNVASKISEDEGAAGQIYLTTRVGGMVAELPASQPFEITVSGIRITGAYL